MQGFAECALKSASLAAANHKFPDSLLDARQRPSVPHGSHQASSFLILQLQGGDQQIRSVLVVAHETM